MHKICKEKISKTFLAANFVFEANVMSMKDSCIPRDTIGRHTPTECGVTTVLNNFTKRHQNGFKIGTRDKYTTHLR